MFARQARRCRVPAQRAPHAPNLVRHDSLTVARTTEDDAAFKLTLGDCHCHRPDEVRIVHGFLGERAEVLYIVPELVKKLDEHALVNEARMVGADSHPHQIEPLLAIRASKISALLRAPSRRITASSPVQSTIVEATPPSALPASRMRSSLSPIWRRTSSADTGSGPPLRFALVPV